MVKLHDAVEWLFHVFPLNILQLSLAWVFHNYLRLKVFVDFHLPLGTGGASVVFFLGLLPLPLLDLEAILGVSPDLETGHVTWKQGCVHW